MKQEANKVQKKIEEEEEQNEDGIPNPPGFTTNYKDFKTPEGFRVFCEVKERVIKSITFTPLMGILMPVVSLFIMGGNIIMGSYQLINLLKTSLNAFMTGVTPDKRIKFQNRLILIASSLGIFIFCIWRASKMGLLGANEPVQTIVDTTPFIIFNQ